MDKSTPFANRIPSIRNSRSQLRLGFCLAALVLALTWSSLSAQTLFTNLVVNPGAEDSAGTANYTTTAPPSGWITTSNFTAVQYAIGGANELNNADSAATGGGSNYFAGEPQNPSSSAFQPGRLRSFN